MIQIRKKFCNNFVIIVINLIIICNYVNCWKPIQGPPSAFTITQSHPAVAAAPLISSKSLSSQSSPSSASSSLLQKSSHIRNTINDAQSGSSDHSYSTASLIGNDHSSVVVADFLQNTDEDILTSADYKGLKFNPKLFEATGFDEDACSVDKYAFDNVGTVTYKNKIPKLDQFTICFWMRFTNHTGDHVIFTYSVRDVPREIQIWIANSKGSSFVSMAIHGQSLYRLNYPMKMRMWHHACSSWNGKTGEWQLWIKNERVGRGFHNRLINHKIPAGGILFSGGPSFTGPVADGLHFEMTLLQIYKVALTAGKAHRDHKHHHVHRFNHDGILMNTPPPPTPPPPPTQMMNSLLVNGQIPTRLQINLARPPAQQQQQQQQQPQPPQMPTQPSGIPSQLLGGLLPGSMPQNQPIINTNFVNGQFNTASRLLSAQLAQQQNSFPAPGPSPLQELQPSASPFTFPGTSSVPQQQQLINSPNIQYIDDIDASAAAGSGTRFIFKRDSSVNEKSITKRAAIANTKTTITTATDDDSKVDDGNGNDNRRKYHKRGLIALNDGSIIDDALLAHGYQFEGLAQFGLPDFKKGLQVHMNVEDEVREHDREPAEEEVKAVMNLCTACDVEPFKGAIAFTWKNAIVSQEHTLKGRSIGGCGYF